MDWWIIQILKIFLARGDQSQDHLISVEVLFKNPFSMEISFTF